MISRVHVAAPHAVVVDGDVIRTPRLTLRPWRADDAPGALAIFGDPEVTRWMAPALTAVSSLEAMERLLADWRDEAASLETPQGRWAVIETATGELVGGAALLLLPPHRVDLQVGWHLGQKHWGHGYAAEAGHAVAHQAFLQGEDEIFAVVRTNNTRGCGTALRVGMEWVGETDKYYDLRLNVFRLRSGDLDVSAATRQTRSRDPHGDTYEAGNRKLSSSRRQGAEWPIEEETVSASHPEITASDEEPVLAKDMVVALTSAELVYSDGATQTFDPNGSTTYVEGGRPTQGEWAVVEDGRFSSFWPPAYRATYDVRWLVKDGGVVGLSFTDAHGSRSDGLYR